MINILMTLQESNFSELSARSYSNAGNTEQDLTQLKKLDKHTSNYLETRAHYLSCVMSAMQVALEDEDIGTFNKGEMLGLSHFMGEELDALGAVFSLRESVMFHLNKANGGDGKQSLEGGE